MMDFNSSLDAMAFDGLLSVAILTIRSSPKSRGIDCMPIPMTYSASPENRAGVVLDVGIIESIVRVSSDTA